MALPNVSITALENAILAKQYEQAEQLFSQILHGQLSGRMRFELEPKGRNLSTEQEDTEAFQMIDRLAALLTIWLVDMNYKPSKWMLTNFYLHKRFITYLFIASSYHNTDHIIRAIGLDKKAQFKVPEVQRMMMLITVDSAMDLPWAMLAKQMPEDTSQAYMGLLMSSSLIMTERMDKRLNKYAALAKELPTIQARELKHLATICDGYFNVSNFTGKDKYEYKKWANKCFEAYINTASSEQLKKRLVDVPPSPDTSKDKPTIVIVHERYTKGHAMYRCYHSMIKGLLNDFNVVAVGPSGTFDDSTRRDAHKVIELGKEFELESAVEKILDESPDIVFYPSIGMSLHAPLLASLRLAPIQAMCPGHPSSSRIASIDYVLMNDMGVPLESLQTFFSEKVVVMGADLQAMSYNEFSVREQGNDSAIIRVAVNGVIQKVSSELLQVCKAITERTGKKIEFQFFMANTKQDLEYYATSSLLRRNLPNSKVHMYSNYNDYMAVLQSCELAIPTFPFCGSNSNMDCLRAGLPKLYIKDERNFVGLTDHRIWNAIGVTHGLCDSIENLIERSVALIENEQELAALRNSYTSFNIEEYNRKSQLDKDDKADARMALTFSKLLNEGV
ncbi:hypothetical protein [Pseudoalteromonas pernae]|uniref:hypothetical protein n=1 Tax=Pseudoalteromonas pernae TaxID=3118054 RepID=UPI003242076A